MKTFLTINGYIEKIRESPNCYQLDLVGKEIAELIKAFRVDANSLNIKRLRKEYYHRLEYLKTINQEPPALNFIGE